MAANRGAVDHMLPVIGQAQFNKRLQQGISYALLCPTAEAHVDGIPLAIPLMHVAPRAPDPQNMQHSVEILPIMVRRARFPPALIGQQSFNNPPFQIRQVAASQNRLLKGSLESCSS